MNILEMKKFGVEHVVDGVSKPMKNGRQKYSLLKIENKYNTSKVNVLLSIIILQL